MSRTLRSYEEKGPLGAVKLHVDMYNPANVPRLIREGPDKVDLFSAVYHGTITLIGLKGISWITGEPISKVGYLLHQIDVKAKQARGLGGLALRAGTVAGVLAVPTAIAVTTTLAYEKNVNKPIRKSHPGSQGTWFGPYGSGFGSVV